MADTRTNFEGGSDGELATLANVNDGTNGGPLTNIVYNNANVPTGGDAAIYFSDEHPIFGTMCLRMGLGTSTTYIRKVCEDTVGGSQARYVARRGFYLPEIPTGSTSKLVMYGNGTTQMATLLVTSAGKLQAQRTGNATITASASTVTLATVTPYVMELACTTESATGAANGKIEWRLTDPAGTVLDSYASTSTLVTGTVEDAWAVRAGNASSSSGTTVDWIDDFDIQLLPTGWIGNPAVSLSVSDSDPDQAVIIATGDGDPSFTIAQTGGPATTPNAAIGKKGVWTVDRSTTATLTYVVTLVGSGTTQTVTIPPFVAVTTGATRVLIKLGGVWS